MIRLLPFALKLAMLVFCLVDCVQTDSGRVRNLPKVTWVFLIVLLPLVGGIAWLVAGRPGRAAGSGPGRGDGHWYARTSGFPEHERPDAAPARDEVDRRVAREQARVDAEFDAAVRRARREDGTPTG
ncbi:PLD nuclease N-terminal domain-containing protein [Kineococcus sp. SYSU DK001]|uniref:PLD nuclease N-terminal domain-containing protein n=1 Tax=Kineococcus sp. SYSU DK001 TaxID=3383122 RepID=UPI003D7CC57F